MSAEILRKAAALMRERAEAALAVTGESWHDVPDLADGSGFEPEPAEHITSWHPAVALAVADWLESHGKAADFNMRQVVAVYGAKHGPDFAKPIDRHALAVARTYLGGDE